MNNLCCTVLFHIEHLLLVCICLSFFQAGSVGFGWATKHNKTTVKRQFKRYFTEIDWNDVKIVFVLPRCKCAWRHLTLEGKEASQSFVKKELPSLSTGMIKFVSNLDSCNSLASVKNCRNVMDVAAVHETLAISSKALNSFTPMCSFMSIFPESNC